MKISYSRQTPNSFDPGFSPNVKETFMGTNMQLSVADGFELLIKEPFPLIAWAVKLRNGIVGKLGFVTGEDQGPYGPFEVNKIDDENHIIKMEDPNFSFYTQLKREAGTKELFCYVGVQFKSIVGRMYFYTIYPFHVLVFKTMLRRMIKLSEQA